MSTITRDNYYQDRTHWSVSQIKRWRQCPARALAEWRGEYSEPPTDAMIFGNLVDHALTQPDRLEAYLQANDCRKKNGELYAWAAKYQEYVARVQREPVAVNMLAGEKQVLLTGTIHGFLFRGLLDCLHLEQRAIVDLKTTAKTDDIWSKTLGRYVPWYDAYCPQGAVYCELARQVYGVDGWRFVLLALGKTDPPSLSGVAMLPATDPEIASRFAFELETLAAELPQFAAMREGQIPAPYCGKLADCAFCREYKPFTIELAKLR
jgi:hypothetical protein